MFNNTARLNNSIEQTKRTNGKFTFIAKHKAIQDSNKFSILKNRFKDSLINYKEQTKRLVHTVSQKIVKDNEQPKRSDIRKNVAKLTNRNLISYMKTNIEIYYKSSEPISCDMRKKNSLNLYMLDE